MKSLLKILPRLTMAVFIFISCFTITISKLGAKPFGDGCEQVDADTIDESLDIRCLRTMDSKCVDETKNGTDKNGVSYVLLVHQYCSFIYERTGAANYCHCEIDVQTAAH